MKNFEQQPDGTFLPTADLMERVRANPEQYPDAVSDFSRLSGKTPDEVQAILDNHGSYFGAVGNRVTDLVQGGSEAVAIAAENLLPESVLGEGATAIRDFSEGLDPKFDTEKGMVETITEGVGQSIPAIAATIGTGGWAGLAIGAGVSTLTWDNEETLAAAMEEVAPGLTPDILVPQEGDSEAVLTLKSLATNTVTDALAMGAFNVAGKALKGLAKSLKGDAAEAAVAQVGPAGAPKVSAQAAQTVEAAAKEAEGLKIDSTISTSEALTRSQKRERELLVAKMNASKVTQPVDEELRQKFLQKGMGAASQLWTPKNPGVKFSDNIKAESMVFMNKVYDALHAGDDATILALARQGVKAANTIDQSYGQAVVESTIRNVLYEKGVGFEQMVALIRETPDIGTRTAAAATLKDYTESILKLSEIDRQLGRGDSLRMLNRKNLLKTNAASEVEAAEKYLTDTYGKEGITLFSDKVEFFSETSKVLEGMGLDITKVIPMIDDMFTEFDKARQGALANLKQNSTVRLSAEEKAKAAGSVIRMIKDVQTTALLSQFSTTGLEVTTNSFNNLLLPIMEHGLSKGNWGRAGREYAGYISGFAKAREIFKRAYLKGEGVVDDFDITEMTNSGPLSYANFPFLKNPGTHLALRMAKLATDTALASSEFWKAVRAQGLAYADGLEMGLQSGLGRVEAKKFAKEYMAKQFSPEGALVNPKYRLDVAETAWQSTFDTRYATGRIGQAIDNVRNKDTVGGLLARSAMPFFRTIVNIGSNSTQFLVPPGLPTALKVMAKSPKHSWLQKVPKTLKALDDFTGANGIAAQNRAVGRQRLGMAATIGAYALVQMNDDIEITGASGFKRWDAKKRSYEEYPANSIIIGQHAFDLNRMLPFSAPLMLVGMMRDMEIETQLQLEDGNYSADNSAAQALVDYVPALALTNLTLFQDGSAMQGVFGLIDAVQQAWQEGKVDAIQLYAEKYAQQFTPGVVKMAAKNSNTTQYEGYDFFSRYAAAAGFPVGLPKLDFAGDPIEHEFGRGLDPFNRKTLHRDSPIHQEFVFLNKTEGLAMVPPKPDAVFDKEYWRKMGVQTEGLLSDGQMPSLTQLQTVDGKNAWETYREYLYQGRLSADEMVTTDVGKVLVKKGENFKDAITRTIQHESYSNLTPDARAHVWKDIFTFFKKGAKEYLEDNVVITPDVFEGSRAGSPINQPTTLSEASKGAKDMVKTMQQTKGSPLDAAFSIQR